MKRKLFYLIALCALLVAPIRASVTVEETTDAEYIINSGYSQITAEDVFMLKNRAVGKPVEPLYEGSQNKFVKGWKKFYSYLDPSIDRPDRLHHDTVISPSATDL